MGLAASRRACILVALVSTAFIAGISLLIAGDTPETHTSQKITDTMKESLFIFAEYHPDEKHVVINYFDKTGAEGPVNVEVLGMATSYRETFFGPQFSITLQFNSVPKYGWAVHPVVMDMYHPEFGHVQLKTEIFEAGQAVPRTIYSILG